MRRGRAIRNVLLLTAIVAGGVGFWLMRRAVPEPPGQPTTSTSETVAPRETTEAQLNQCLGQPASEVVQRLQLGEVKWYWTDEPPGILRGVSYHPADDRQVTLYIAEGEPLFRQFNDRFEWDYKAFLQCRVGGIQYTSGEVRLDIGPAVPWQFRQH